MPHVEAYFHFVWATKFRQKTITPAIENIIIDTIHNKSRILRCPIHSINTAHDHIHIAVTISPAIAAAHWVRQVKSVSSLVVNREFEQLESPFRWQGDYSIYTLGRKAMPFLLKYIAQQKERHAKNNIEPYLEKIPEDKN